MSEKPISPLRQRMIEDMTVRNFVEKTRNDYIRQVKTFTSFLGRSPDTATAEDLRRFQLQWTRSAATSPVNTSLCLPPHPPSLALGPIATRRTYLPPHSNPHSRVRGTFRAPSPAGSFLGGFRTPATAHLARSSRPASETLNMSADRFMQRPRPLWPGNRALR
jgi:hypothetical protein